MSDIKTINPKVKKTFKCNKCDNSFTLKAKYSVRCPYCGSEKLINYRDADDAQALIDESSNDSSDKD